MLIEWKKWNKNDLFKQPNNNWISAEHRVRIQSISFRFQNAPFQLIYQWVFFSLFIEMLFLSFIYLYLIRMNGGGEYWLTFCS